MDGAHGRTGASFAPPRALKSPGVVDANSSSSRPTLPGGCESFWDDGSPNNITVAAARRSRTRSAASKFQAPGVRVVVRVVRVVGQDAFGDAARRRLADGKRRDAVERFGHGDGRDVERAQRGPRRVPMCGGVTMKNVVRGCIFRAKRTASRIARNTMRKVYARALTRTPAPHSTISARAWRCLRRQNGSRGACSVARIRSPGIEVGLRNARAALRVLWCPRIAVFEEFCDLGW